MPAQITYFYYYPNGKNGDINHYLAKKYGSVESCGALQKAVLTTENHEWFDGLQTGVTRGFTQRDLHVLKQQNSAFICFLSTYHIPSILQNTLNECYMCEIPIPIDLLKASDSALKKWRTLKTALRKELYTNLVLEGYRRSKWTSEQRVFLLIKDYFPDAVYQYRADWLGFQSLDVYIPSIQVGIEYQGKQHFMPVSLFGGNKGFQDRQRLDQRKRQRCTENNVTLIEWNYDEPISKELAEEKLWRWL